MVFTYNRTIDALRTATEDDVVAALDGAVVETPLSDPVALLEFYNRMLDVMTGEHLAAQIEDLRRITEAAGMTTLH